MCLLAFKVAILLEELNIPYEKVFKELHDLKEGPNGVKHPNYLAINPNGRVPAIIGIYKIKKWRWKYQNILINKWRIYFN